MASGAILPNSGLQKLVAGDTLNETDINQVMEAVETNTTNMIRFFKRGVTPTGSLSADQTASIPITFGGQAFQQVPTVVLTPKTDAGKVEVGITDNAASGFTMSVKALVAGYYYIYWLAVGK